MQSETKGAKAAREAKQSETKRNEAMQRQATMPRKYVQWVSFEVGTSTLRATIGLSPKTWKYEGPVSKMHGKEKMTHHPVSNRESIEANPDFVCEIEDMKANVGFTKADCTLRVTAELLFDPVD